MPAIKINREQVQEAARRYVEARKYARAVSEYQKLVSDRPNDARMIHKLGDVYLRMGAYAEAATTFERAGIGYERAGHAEKAAFAFGRVREIVLKRAPELRDSFEHVWTRLATVHETAMRPKMASEILIELADSLAVQRRDDELVAVRRRIVEHDDARGAHHAALAEALVRTGAAEAALESFQVAATWFAADGHRDAAIAAHERALTIAPSPSHARAVAELYLARGNPGDAALAVSRLRVCFQGVAAGAADVAALTLLGRALLGAGHADRSREVFAKIARIERGHASERPPAYAAPLSPPPRPAPTLASAPAPIAPPSAASPFFTADSDALAATWDDADAPEEISVADFVEETPSYPPPRKSHTVARAPSATLEASLEQIDVLLEQGQLAEARCLLERELATRCGNPLLVERMFELEARLRLRAPRRDEGAAFALPETPSAPEQDLGGIVGAKRWMAQS